MFQKKLKAAAWLLNTAVFLLTVVVGALAYQLVTNKDALLGQEEEVFYCGTIDEDFALLTGEDLQNETGKALFLNNCIQCHGFTEVVVGPALAGVMKRHSKEWVYSFVLNSSKMIEEKDSAAVAIFEEYAKTQMPAFAFSRAELDSLFDYINSQPRDVPAVETD